MYRPFYPGAPRDVDEAARKIRRLLDQQGAADASASATRAVRLSAAQPVQLAQNGQAPGTGLTDDDVFKMFAFDNTGKWEDLRNGVYYDSKGFQR